MTQKSLSGIESIFKFETEHMNPDCYERVQAQDVAKEQSNEILTIKNLKKTYDNGV